MKHLLTILLFSLIFQFCNGQDIISLKDKKQLNVNVIEKSDKLVKYKMTDYETGPIISIKTNRISRIEYKNGVVDPMGYQNPRKNKSLGFNFGIAHELSANGGMFTYNIDYFIIPQVDLEMTLGASDFSGGIYFAAGSRFHLNSDYSEKRITPFTGLLLGSNYGDEFVQIPVGVSYNTFMGFSTSLIINEMISFNSWYSTFVELRVGWRFKI